ncbi:MAG: protein translocase component YidC [Ammonifex sp.]|nr:MAG: protein translocase component YidC [Ammonifex sp.]
MGELFGALVDGITWILTRLYDATAAAGVPSYGLAIILLTAMIKIVLYPLNYKQMHSMVAMQRLQPKLKEIQEKHKKDPQKLQQKMMELYRENGVNPMAGCLPLLIQLPILFALYRALLNLFQTPNVEHLNFLGFINLAQRGSFGDPASLILPILAGASTWWQMRLTPQAGGQEQAMRTMSTIMPVMFAYISFTLPAGLALYWVVFNLLSVGQQYIINRRLFTVGKEALEGEGSGKKR